MGKKISPYCSRISEVVIGATSAVGGTRDRSHTIGGETAPAFHYSEGFSSRKQVISHDVFDMPISLPGHVRENFQDVMEDTVKWAKYRVEKCGAQMINLHTVSTDPGVKDTPIKDACRTIEDVPRAVKVPIIIGGCGIPKKDPMAALREGLKK
jgi:acetyl-CoA decarbonylase/synthase complex subunit delta